jgi:hypothetical protein
MIATKLIGAAAVMIAALTGAFVTSASAAPLGGMSKGTADTAQVQTIDYRGYRHCHWRNGHKWCHDGSSSYYRPYRYGYYGYAPGIYLNFGFGKWGHRHHHRFHRH